MSTTTIRVGPKVLRVPVNGKTRIWSIPTSSANMARCSATVAVPLPGNIGAVHRRHGAVGQGDVEFVAQHRQCDGHLPSDSAPGSSTVECELPQRRGHAGAAKSNGTTHGRNFGVDVDLDRADEVHILRLGGEMLGRRRHPHGGQSLPKRLGPKVWVPHTRVKDPDGHLREVERRGTSKTAAENALKLSLSNRRRTPRSTVTGSTRIRQVGELWLAQCEKRVDVGDRAPRSPQDYQSTWLLRVEPGRRRAEVVGGKTPVSASGGWSPSVNGRAPRRVGGPGRCCPG